MFLVLIRLVVKKKVIKVAVFIIYVTIFTNSITYVLSCR